MAYNGDILTLRTAIQRQEMPSILSIRGFSQMISLNSQAKNDIRRESS